MQKFNEFVREYQKWKMNESGSAQVTKGEIKALRETFASLEKRGCKKPLPEALKKMYKKELQGFKEWKEKKGKGKLTQEDIRKVREHVTMEYKKSLKVKKLHEKNNRPRTSEEKLTERSLTFQGFVNSFREWKFQTKGDSRLTENEKAKLKETFFSMKGKEKNEPSAHDSRFTEILHGYASWKKSQGQSEVLTESEKRVLMRSYRIECINSKLSEVKKHVADARAKLQEGDLMGGAADTQAAGQDLNQATADANAIGAGDPNAVPLPQNIVDEISNLKTSIDSLAAEAGIQSPVDMNSNPDAGIEQTMDVVADPNAAAQPAVADPNAVTDQNAGMAPIAERMNYKNSYGTKRFNEAKSDPTEKELVVTPGFNDLKNGYPKSGEVAPAQTWPNKEIPANVGNKKLGNIEESEELSEEARQAFSTLDEQGNFSWSNFLKMKRERL